MPEVKKPKHLEDLGVQGTETQKWLEQFEALHEEEREPRSAIETTGLHEEVGLESVYYATPKKLPAEQITWNYVRDIQEYWAQRTPTLYKMLLFAALVFLMIFWQFYGYAKWS
jgi:hypothetical protein